MIKDAITKENSSLRTIHTRSYILNHINGEAVECRDHVVEEFNLQILYLQAYYITDSSVKMYCTRSNNRQSSPCHFT